MRIDNWSHLLQQLTAQGITDCNTYFLVFILVFTNIECHLIGEDRRVGRHGGRRGGLRTQQDGLLRRTIMRVGRILNPEFGILNPKFGTLKSESHRSLLVGRYGDKIQGINRFCCSYKLPVHVREHTLHRLLSGGNQGHRTVFGIRILDFGIPDAFTAARTVIGEAHLTFSEALEEVALAGAHGRQRANPALICREIGKGILRLDEVAHGDMVDVVGQGVGDAGGRHLEVGQAVPALLQRDGALLSRRQPLTRHLHTVVRLAAIDHVDLMVVGMPESVAKWVETNDYLQCQEVQDDILTGYEDDFPKYKKKIDPQLLSATMKSAAVQATKKFVYARVPGDYKTAEVKKALEMLIKAGILIPVTHTDANGLPLGDERDDSTRKMLLLDTGLMLRLLNMSLGDITTITTQILTASAADFVNKGPMAEMLAGLELLHYRTPNLKHELFYWMRPAKNATAEIDYVLPRDMQVLPLEVKAGVQGGMKSLWEFMRDKQLTEAVRCSLKNFGMFDNIDSKAANATRHVTIVPLYAISQLKY